MEKAHQRGITHEGDANFAAFLACAQPANTTYFRYAAYLFATRYLLSEASNYLPRDEVDAAWELLSDGPKDDIRAIRDFWRRYEGPAAILATTMNDQYLRTMQVQGGVQSYGTVVQMLVALDREGGLFRVGSKKKNQRNGAKAQDRKRTFASLRLYRYLF